MNKVVLITGNLAAGKSTLADSLSEKLNFTCIKKDDVKEIICDSVGFNNRDENRRISVAAVNSMILFLEQTLKIGGDIILEANFRLSEILNIKEIAHSFGANVSIIYLIGNPEILYKRFLDRVPGRHRAHLSMGLDKDYSKYLEYISELRKQIDGIECLKIDSTELNLEEVTNQSISYLNK